MIEIKEMVKPWAVKEVRELTDATYVLRFHRNDMQFRPGQHLVAGLVDEDEAREYSIYSGINDEYLEILVREVEKGSVSCKLKKLKPGNILNIKGPYGFFMYNTQPPSFKKFIFLATGTGIAPFHSFARTFPNADYKIIHGIREINEAYDKDHFGEGKYISCTSLDNKGDYQGRVTSYIKEAKFDKDVMIYLCGNSEMVYESMDILQEKGFSSSQIYTEVYF
jgi:ferredoxin/flavodoxin---NADP+ reductase